MRIPKLFRLCSIITLTVTAVGCESKADKEIYVDSMTPAAELAELDVTNCRNFNLGINDDGRSGNWSPPYDGAYFQAVLGPDKYASYWLTPIPVLNPQDFPGAHFEIRGQFPKSRYFSFHNNNDAGQVIDVRADTEVLGYQSANNPFVTDDEVSGGEYRLRIIDALPADQTNPAGDMIYGGARGDDDQLGEMNQLVYRIYDSAPDPKACTETDPSLDCRDLHQGLVGLPRIYYVYPAPDSPQDGPTLSDICGLFPDALGMDVEALEQAEAAADKAAPVVAADTNHRVPGYDPVEPNSWFVGKNFQQILNQGFPTFVDDEEMPEDVEGGFYMNTHSNYIAAYLTPMALKEGYAVVRLKRPAKEDVRYFSFMLHQTLNFCYLHDGRRDNDLQNDPSNSDYLTLVIGPLGKRPYSVPEENYMDYGSGSPVLLMRWLMPSDGFNHAPNKFEGKAEDYQGLEEHLGEYYPAISYCGRQQIDLGKCTPLAGYIQH
jgi:hypothetical protein